MTMVATTQSESASAERGRQESRGGATRSGLGGLELKDLARTPASRRGVPQQAHGWFADLERRRVGSYLPC
jgi:hypothetical protein